MIILAIIWFGIGIFSACKAAKYHYHDEWGYHTPVERVGAIIEVGAWLLLAPLLYLLIGVIWVSERKEG